MNSILSAALPWLAGILLGVMFYGGLWWTIRASLSSQLPGLLFLSSMLSRMGLSLLGFYLVAGDQWQALLYCLLGFIMARALITKITHSASLRASNQMQKDSHAP